MTHLETRWIRASLVLPLLLASSEAPSSQSTGAGEKWRAPNRSLRSGSRSLLGTGAERSASVRLGNLDGDGDLDAMVAKVQNWPAQDLVHLNRGRDAST